MPIALDYDTDGNVVGGHYVDVLPERRFESSRGERAFDFKPPNLYHHLMQNTRMPVQRHRQQGHLHDSVMHPSPRTPLGAARSRRPAPMPDQRNRMDSARPGSFHSVGFHRNGMAVNDSLHQQSPQTSRPPTQPQHYTDAGKGEQVALPVSERERERGEHQMSHRSRSGASDEDDLAGARSLDFFTASTDGGIPHTTGDEAPEAEAMVRTPQPVRQFDSIKMLDATPSPYSKRQVSPSLEKARGFIASFTEHFTNDIDAVDTFEQLCLDFNRKAIEPQDFYASVYLILLRTDSLHLLPGFLAFLPPLWKETDLTWLNRAIETKHREASQSEQSRSPASPESALPKKRIKKRPINGFSTNSSDSEMPRQVAKIGSPSLYIDPAALSKSTGPHLLRDRFASSESTGHDEDAAAIPRRIVKLKISTRLSASAPTTPPAKRKLKRRKTKRPFVPSTPATANDPTNSEDLSSTPLTRKGRFRYGLYTASEIHHFGHYPTRRAVLARASRPYVHLVCGVGFAHPHDVKDHHSNVTGKKGGQGCVAKVHNPKKKKLEWDAHPSCKIGYPDLNYTKVKDGYIVLDQETADKIEKAVGAGLEFLNNVRAEAVSDDGDGEEEDSEGENEDDDGSSDDGNDEDADGDIEMADAPGNSANSTAGAQEVSAVATHFGLRKRSARLSYDGM